MLMQIGIDAREYRRLVAGCYGERTCKLPIFSKREIMPNPPDIPSFIQTLTAALVADILESCSPDEILQLVEELELRLRRSRLH